MKLKTGILALTLFLTGSVGAHPFLQDSWWVVMETNRLVMRVSATLREVAVAQKLGNATNTVSLDRLMGSLTNHGDYLLQALRVESDGVPLDGEVLDFQWVTEGGAEVPADSPLFLDQSHVTYDLEYPLAPGAAPAQLQFGHRTLTETPYAPGILWEVTYALLIKDAERRDLGAGLVRADLPYVLELASAPPAAVTNAVPARNAPLDTFDPTTARPPFAQYLHLGVHHILTGYDHILFLAALALAAVTLGDFLKLILTFTVAHSITVTLAALGWVRLPPWFVEPFIAASIVFVAVENLVAPRRDSAPSRLAVAFGFGLVHGLGFAQGLRESLAGLGSGRVALAILAFCLGVELGHLFLGLPFWGLLRAGRAEWGERFGRECLRWGSVAVALGGLWFLVAAVRAYV
ncbi:MAG: HupE/UreJ family protein [Verrucomicrobia bacterium]|nr:HupE/UreJ family protein [Verrucomicrobiota bacterium]